MSHLLETIRIEDGCPQGLSRHEERMNRSRRELFGFSEPISLTEYLTVPENALSGIFRCRVIYEKEIARIEFHPYSPAVIRSLLLTDAGELEYSHKYENREAINALIDKSKADDILIVRDGLVTDSSFANVAFRRDDVWVTPDTPLLRGTMRHHLILQGIVTEERITVGDIRKYSHFRLINAMLGFSGPQIPVRNIHH